MSKTDPANRYVARRYRLTEELGRGGMGRVWRAHDEQLNRMVAVKELLLPPGIDDDERNRLASRTKREAQAAAMGAHPSIVTVHDVVVDDERPWIVMECLSGTSMQHLVRQSGAQPTEKVAAWGQALLDALMTAHQLGIMHRDVKPANVMVTNSGRVVLTDFGIAFIEGESTLTQSSGLLGSPAYIAPERVHYAPATPGSDLWALGATLYFAAAGFSPFKRPTLEATMHAILREQPPPTSGTSPLTLAIEGLLRKDPDVRIDAKETRRLLETAGEAPTHLSPAPRAGAGTAASADSTTTVLPPSSDAPQVETGTATATGIAGSAHSTTTSLPPGSSTPNAPAAASSRFTWPVAITVLGAGVLVIATIALFLFVPEDSAPPMDLAGGTSQSPESSQEEPTADPASPQSTGATGQEPENTSAAEGAENTPAPGATLTADPRGFEMPVPDGWSRRIENTSIFYESPNSDAYMQIDLRKHPVDDQLEHIRISEEATKSSGRLPGYERVRITDLTGQLGAGYVSAAEWEFEWNNGGHRQHMLTRNITLEPGNYVTMAWSAPTAQWESQAALREACFSGFSRGSL